MMTIEERRTLTVEDIDRIEYQCPTCKVSTVVPLTQESLGPLTHENPCSCKRELWHGGDDTRLAKELIGAIVRKDKTVLILKAQAGSDPKTCQ